MNGGYDAQVYAPARANGADQGRRPFAMVRADTAREIHNARGLIMAVAMSAACWAAIGVAFLF